MFRGILGFLVLAIGLGSQEPVLSQSSEELREVQNKVKAMFKLHQYAEAVPYAEIAIQLSEEEFGNKHPTTAAFHFNLGKLYQLQSRFTDAQSLYERALKIRVATLGAIHADVAASHNSLGRLFEEQDNLTDAEKHYSRALEVMQSVLADNPHAFNSMSRIATKYRARAYHNRARLLHVQGKYADSENLFGAAMVMMRSSFGEKHSEVARGYENYALLLRDMGRPEEAQEKESYAKAIRAQKKR